MSSKIKRVQGLKSAKTTTQEKSMKIDGFADLVKQLQEMTVASVQSQESLTKSLKELSLIVAQASQEGVDMQGVIEAINGLKDKLEQKEAVKMPMDYEIHFTRDKYNLMESGIRLTSVPRKLN